MTSVVPHRTDSVQAQREVVAASLRSLLRPLVRLLLRSGVPYGLFADIAKQTYVEIATDQFQIPGRKQTVSRVAVITGLTRKEITRIQELADQNAAELVERYNRAARVVAGWIRDPRFADENGAPLALPLEGNDISFSALVREFSGDIPPRAIRDELVDTGAAELLPDGCIRLLTRAYVPGDSKADKLSILGTDVAHLIATIAHNVCETDVAPRFQRKVAYDNLPAEVLADLRSLSSNECQLLLEKLDRWLAAHDRDTNPKIQGSGRKRAGVGIYYFEDDAESGESK
jgi:hypothetical protein